MIKVAQFGEGNFLRTFVDLYFQTLNDEGADYEVHIIKPIERGSLDAFDQQKCRYHAVLRGMENEKATEKVYPISAVANAFSPFEEPEKYYALARDPQLQLIVSNTTEAGICYHDTDRFEDFASITFPAKLTKFLYERFCAGLGGVYLLPVELIESNADALYRCVNDYITLWGLPEAFRLWNNRENHYCNTLVDRIVSGYPKTDELRAHITDLLGKEDALVSIGEPFGLWVVENKGDIARYIKDGMHNIEVILTADISYYKKRKVRVLNGSHTNLVAAGLILGKETVYDCMTDPALHTFFEDTLSEIVPFVSEDIKKTTAFARDVEARFNNPFLHHALTGIALNSISKWKARVLPSFSDYYHKNGRVPRNMTVGFAYLMYLYMTKYDTLCDEAIYLAYFAGGKPLYDLMKSKDLWGEDLTRYAGFYEAVKAGVAEIEAGHTIL